MDYKEWIANQINTNAKTWDDLKNLPKDDFDDLVDEGIIPRRIRYADWPATVEERRRAYVRITGTTGIGNNVLVRFPVPTGIASCWAAYKRILDKVMLADDVTNVQLGSQWILNQLARDAGVKKGLVMGSVQSGKTANMVGLVSMAADYDWNFFVILSGTIDNLRVQTRNRFIKDLQDTDAVQWHMLDYGPNADVMTDLRTEKLITADNLNLNSLNQEGAGYAAKYVMVCLKQSQRLQNLISWLHSSPTHSKKIRLLIIDDEADQASVNTKLMKNPVDDDPEDDVERTKINQSIVDLVGNCATNSLPSENPLQSINYISYTATPYANILNEKIDGYSLYPEDFIYSLPEPDAYFGAKVIFGSHNDPQRYPGLNVIRTIPEAEYTQLEHLTDDPAHIPTELEKSIEWFFCAAAVLRMRNTKPKPISMLIHTSARVRTHLKEYLLIAKWLRTVPKADFIAKCQTVYDNEAPKFTKSDFSNAFSVYPFLNDVTDLPPFSDIKDEIALLLQDVTNIAINGADEFEFTENGVHLCVDNSISPKYTARDVYARIVYPDDAALAKMKKSPVFIVFGGNTLSRGLTLEGLTCTYFARKVSQADTLMQMARWFGYRKGSELLQRIWLTEETHGHFRLLQEIDEELKNEFASFIRDNKSPKDFGPKVLSLPAVKKLTITAKNKMQAATTTGNGYDGDAYETTKFRNDTGLRNNLDALDRFIAAIGRNPVQSEHSTASWVWRNVDVSKVLSFLRDYKAYDNSNAKILKTITDANATGKYLAWNVCIVGNQHAQNVWPCCGNDVGKSVRSKSVFDPDVDIKRLRNGIDALTDVEVSKLTPEQKYNYDDAKDTGSHVFFTRGFVGLEDVPVLLLYRIDKDAQKTGQDREPINTTEDVVGYAIIISGDGKTSTGPTYVNIGG